MNKERFLASIKESLEEVLQDYHFNNYKKQIVSWRLNPTFKRTYKESYLWSKTLFLSTNASILINEGYNKRLAIKCLKECAEVYENLHYITEEFDKDYCLILSSLCYDLAGYQANALCLIRKIHDYEFQTSDERVEISPDNYILNHIRQILLKNIPKAKTLLHNDFSSTLGIGLFNQGISNWYQNVLNGDQNDFLNETNNTYQFYLESGNVTISHLLFLLKTRLKVFLERSIWENLNQFEHIRTSQIWQKYIKLLTHDFYSQYEIKNIEKRISKFEFWTSQLRAIQKGLLDKDENFVVQMPTSAGKTFIAEIAILNALTKYPNKKCIYVAPFRALTNEKENELSDYLSKLGYSISSLVGSYDIDDFQDMILEDTDVLIATPEKIDLLLRLNPDYFKEVSLVVVDEGHIVGDISPRSSLLEFLIIRLRIKIESLKTLFISAVMPPTNADEYSVWLTGSNKNVIRSLLHQDSSINEEWEPTRKLIGYFIWDGDNGRINYKDVDTEDENTRLKIGTFVPKIIYKKKFASKYPNKPKTAKTDKGQTSACLTLELAKDGNCLIFCAQPRNAEGVGNKFLEILNKMDEVGEEYPNFFNKNMDTESYFFANKWFGKDSNITKCIERGIGIHYGDMPEAVRKSVEIDYSLGKLRVLISTNTIGQGLNFPIKHLIIHSTLIAQDKPVSVRDFWNIVGRAGRAGRETEGQIVFVINSYTDMKAFDRYTDKANIESAVSMFAKVLLALVKERISSETYESFIRILSEPYLLNLIVEESIETDTQKIIEKIIENSLFKVQAGRKQIDLQPLRNSFNSIVNRIKGEIPAEILIIFGQTGFSLDSNNAISNFIELNEDEIRKVVAQDNYLHLLFLIFSLFDEGVIQEIKSKKLHPEASIYFDVTQKWIEGNEIDKLNEEFSKINSNPNLLNVLISEGYYFRYVWGVTSFITILTNKLGINRKDLPEGIRNLASYIKYGLNNATACLARSLGIKNRDIAILLVEKSRNQSGKDFIRWLSNLTINDINRFELNPYDTKNILSVALKLTPNKSQNTLKSFEFYIRGISYNEAWKQTSLIVEIGDKLSYNRDEVNEYDPFAIKILKGKNDIGFVPREFAKTIAVEIDINSSQYEITVLATKIIQDRNSIYVRMTKIS